MSKRLNISPDLSLPLDAATETFGIMGRRGSGKSHTGSVMAEEMLAQVIPIITYDPTGAWYGLKSSPDGKSAGYPVVIFGGEHEDVPLAETDGEMVARAIVAERFPAILDCSLLRKGARLRFMADFLETLYHENREAVHFFADEIHTIAPLQLRNVGEASVYQSRCVGAIEDIILQGRRRGIGMTGLSQRPALVNANVRSQFGTLIAMQIVAPLDRKAIAEWIAEKGTEEEGKVMLAQLPRLERGTGIVWSPTFDILKTVKFRARTTFDSGRTPGVGERRVEPKVWAKIDVDKLGKTIAAKREEKKANDPAALKRRVAELEKQLAAKPAAVAAPAPQPKVKTVERFVLKDGQLDRADKLIGKLADAFTKAQDLQANVKATADELAAAIKLTREPAPAPQRPIIPNRPASMQQPDRIIHRSPKNMQAAPVSVQAGAAVITARQKRFLDAAATLLTLNAPVTRETVCAWVGVHPRGGSVGEELKALQDAGLITVDRGLIQVSAEGIAGADRIDPAQAIERAKASLTPRQLRIFDIVVTAYPEAVTREKVAEEMGIHPRGGSLGEDIARLAGRGLIDSSRGSLRARDFLFAGESV